MNNAIIAGTVCRSTSVMRDHTGAALCDYVEPFYATRCNGLSRAWVGSAWPECKEWRTPIWDLYCRNYHAIRLAFGECARKEKE
jgi:hypothetical protein